MYLVSMPEVTLCLLRLWNISASKYCIRTIYFINLRVFCLFSQKVCMNSMFLHVYNPCRLKSFEPLVIPFIAGVVWRCHAFFSNRCTGLMHNNDDMREFNSGASWSSIYFWILVAYQRYTVLY